MAPEKKQELLKRFIDFLYGNRLFYDINIYTDGHLYSDDANKMTAIECRTDKGNIYYDNGEEDVSQLLEFANPDTLTFTFEGEFYDRLHCESPRCDVFREALKELLAEYGLSYRMGYDWSIALFEAPEAA